ncbi:reverse transcriptase domain-containing protein, partial [Tanacetum coccineum]
QRLVDSAFQTQLGRNLEAYVDNMIRRRGRKILGLHGNLGRSAERSLPFLETLKNITKDNKDDYRWTKNAERAFQEMKRLITKLPYLTTPVPKEMLYVYFAASQDAVSEVLLAKRKGKQTPI